MNSFFKTTLATVLGMFLYGVIIMAFCMMSIVGMIASGDQTRSVEKNSVLVLNLNCEISDQAAEDDMFGSLMGDALTNMGLNEITEAIDKAKDNENIKGIYMEASGLSAGPATLKEIRGKLEEFKATGKWIVAYADTYTQGAYYLASVANKVFLNPQGMLDWHGIAAQPMYYKDLMAKLGIKYQIVKVGTYKSATEVYTETKMSDANREQMTAYITGLWKTICDDVSGSRNISVEDLNALADRYMLFEGAAAVKETGLVDELLYADEMKAEVKKMLDIDEDDDINQIGVKDMKIVKGAKEKGDEIAIYYAEGDIVQQVSNFSTSTAIVGKTVVDDLNELAKDEDVKAVVLRVNSPGGDAYASEQIWHAVCQLKEKKPVVVSMGDYAASGGYYISCGASWIVAQPTTLTGSIGIFAAIPDFSGLTNDKLGLKFDEVKTNRNSAFGNMMARSMNDEEINLLQNYVNNGYALFLSRVAEGRGQTTEYIDTIGQGRVWLGTVAIDNKLVDELGGLEIAIKKAAELAELKEYHTAAYPGKPGIIESLMKKTTNNDDNYLNGVLRSTFSDLYEPFMMLQDIKHQPVLQTRLEDNWTISL